MNETFFLPSDVLHIYTLKNGIPIPFTNASNVVYIEGDKTETSLTKYERNDDARKECLKIHGYTCSVCGMNFLEKYGELGRGFIHVHHKIPISSIGKNYIIDPEIDLIPVCPNCHAMLHKNSQDEPLGIGELKRIVERIK